MERFLSVLSDLVSPEHKRAVLSSSNPCARAIKFIWNKLRAPHLKVFPCEGILKGYYMKLDEQTYKGYVSSLWEANSVDAICKVELKGNTAMDIGSHIGFYALLLSKLVGHDGVVIAFEPMVENFKLLKENLSLNQCINVRAENKAVADYSSERKFVVPRVAYSTRSSLDGLALTSDADIINVKAVSIDDYVSDLKAPVQFIKIDAEGAEELIIRGAKKTIELYHPTMMIELHHFDSSPELHPVIDILNKAGYKVEWLDKSQFTSHIFAKWN